MIRRRWLALLLLGGGLASAWILMQFRPPPAAPDLPSGYSPVRAAWLSIDWAMNPHSEIETITLASELSKHNIAHAFIYVSYLKPEGFFNPTYDHALAFTQQLKAAAPEIALYAWIGVPVQGNLPGGEYIDNRLQDPALREALVMFSRMAVEDLGFDGIHLNAEMVDNGDDAFVSTLQSIREQLPPTKRFSIAAHPQRLAGPVTVIPYPVIRHHWTPEYFRRVAENVDQIAVMAYDSGLFFPVDYRNWMAYQVQVAATLAENDLELFIGLPVSEEWTPSHQLQAESLTNALYGFREGLARITDAENIDGIALYPYWEIDDSEWQALDVLP